MEGTIRIGGATGGTNLGKLAVTIINVFEDLAVWTFGVVEFLRGNELGIRKKRITKVLMGTKCRVKCKI